MKPSIFATTAFIVAFLSLMLSAWARGQGSSETPPKNEVPPNYAAELVRMPKVRKDLALSEDQTEKLLAIKPRLDKEFKSRFDKAQHDVDDTRGLQFGQLVGEYWRIADERVLPLLGKAQRERLRAIQYQSLGFRALLLEELRKSLSLTPAQVNELDGLAGRARERRSACVRSHVIIGTTASDKEDLDAIEAESDALALKVLTERQAAQYRKRLGARLHSVEGTSPWVFMIVID